MHKASCCHSGLSGIFLENNLCNPELKKDSGQAGMTEFDRVLIYNVCVYTYEPPVNKIITSTNTTAN